MKVLLATGALAISMTAPCAMAQSADELRQQLEAQKAINEQLRRRVEELERQISGRPLSERPALQDLGSRAPLTSEPETPESTTAIREALVARGLVLLPKGSFRLIPGISWTHSGSDALRTRSDTYVGSLSAQAGLPWGMMLSASAPYVSSHTAVGSNKGTGDWTIGLAKQLVDESNRFPALVASLGYQDNSGKEPFASVPIGFGFPVASARLAALKRIDPVVLYGDVSYSHPYARNVSEDNFLGESRFAGRIAPGDARGLSFGASLVATPEITFDAGLSLSFVDGTAVHSAAAGDYTQPKATVAFFTLGSSFLIARQLALLVSAGAGLTNDSPDFVLSVSLPYRF